MTEPVSLEQIKQHLRLDPDDTSDDEDLQDLLVAARRKVELETNRTIVGDVPTLTGDDLVLAGRAVRLLVGHWYANREAATGDARTLPAEMPMSARWILEGLAAWDDGSC